MADPEFPKGATNPKGVDVNLLLPPANEVCEGYVFTGVCLSTGGGRAWWQGGMRGAGMCGIRWDTVNERAVPILLECILVLTIFSRKLDEIEKNWIEMGVRVPRAPWDPPLTSYFFRFEPINFKGQLFWERRKFMMAQTDIKYLPNYEREF